MLHQTIDTLNEALFELRASLMDPEAGLPGWLPDSTTEWGRPIGPDGAHTHYLCVDRERDEGAVVWAWRVCLWNQDWDDIGDAIADGKAQTPRQAMRAAEHAAGVV